MDEIAESWKGWAALVRPVTKILFEQLGSLCMSGPFLGMDVSVYEHPVWDDSNAPSKLIGVYEFELHAAIRKAASRRPNCIINVGCGEGYYAIGLARLIPDAQIIAMDKSNEALDAVETNARLNKIYSYRLSTVVGHVGPQDLQRGTGKKLYVVDIEGYESSVLDPERCPDLLRADIIVECHDFFVPEHHEQITDILAKRFARTHEVERIEFQVPNPNDFPFLNGLPYGYRLLAITERRPPRTAWLACWAKQENIDG